MSILSGLIANSGDDIARAVANNADDALRTAANQADDIARIVANKGDDALRIAAKNTDNASTALGKLLSPEQEAFFKDSVVRDANGNLMPMYHGSASKFTVFDKSKGGQSNGTAKVGHWFTPSKEGAEKWANSAWWGDKDPTVYETFLNIKKPMVYEAVDNSAQIKKLKDQLEQAYDNINSTYRGSKEYYDAYKVYNDISRKIDDLSFTDPYEQFRSHIYAMEGKTPSQANAGGVGMVMEDEDAAIQKYIDMLKSEGFDGIIIKGTGYDQNVMGGLNDQYVVFDPNQIKSTSNKKPTLNPNIMLGLGGIAGGGAILGGLLNGDQNKTGVV